MEGVEAHDFGSYLQLRWRWPPGCEVAVVAWRGDGYPTDADDPQATRRRVSKGELEQHGGFRLERPAAGPLHFVVFAAARVGADEVCSAGLAPGCRAALRARAPVTIAYDVTWGLFRRQRGTVVVRCAEAVAVLPELVLVARRGDVQPLRLDEGVAVATVAGASIPGGGSVSSEFALDGVRPPAYLRAFFRDPDAYQRFKLVDPHPSQLRVR